MSFYNIKLYWIEMLNKKIQLNLYLFILFQIYIIQTSAYINSILKTKYGVYFPIIKKSDLYNKDSINLNNIDNYYTDNGITNYDYLLNLTIGRMNYFLKIDLSKSLLYLTEYNCLNCNIHRVYSSNLSLNYSINIKLITRCSGSLR